MLNNEVSKQSGRSPTRSLTIHRRSSEGQEKQEVKQEVFFKFSRLSIDSSMLTTEDDSSDSGHSSSKEFFSRKKLLIGRRSKSVSEHQTENKGLIRKGENKHKHNLCRSC